MIRDATASKRCTCPNSWRGPEGRDPPRGFFDRGVQTNSPLGRQPRPPTFEREIRSLHEAATAHPDARKLLIVDRPMPRAVEVPRGVELVKLWQWLLEPSVG